MELSSHSSQPSSHVAKKPLDEIIIIKQAEKEENKNIIKDYNFDFKKYNFHEEEIQKDNIKENIAISQNNSIKKEELSICEIDLRSDTSSVKKMVPNIKNSEEKMINMHNENKEVEQRNEDIQSNIINNIENQYLPFNIFQKEKCKNINFNQINIEYNQNIFLSN